MRLEKISGLNYRNLEEAIPEEPVILITNTHTRLNQLSPDLLKSTKLIVHSNSGYDNFTEDRKLWENIPIIVGHEIRAQAVAEYYLSALLNGLSEIPQHLIWNRSRRWERPLIKDQNILLIGHGHVGQILNKALKALGCNVVIIDPLSGGDFSRWEEVKLDEYKIVLLCCSLNSSTYHLCNEVFFEKAHPELLMINGARGKIVQEKALREFLLTHPKAMAYLDVFEQEPFGESWHHFPQVWKTSHIAGVYSDLDEAIIKFEEKIINDFLSLKDHEFKLKYKMQLLQNKWIKGELI
jgi:D-3-phosphoglycerate dehydrogenase